MLYTTIIIDNYEYKLRLSAKSCVELEKRLNGNPLNVFMRIEQGVLPTLETLLIMLHQSLQDYQHGITMDNVYTMYDKYCAGGHNMMDLIQVLIEVLKVSGFMPQDGEQVKNA